MQITLLAFAQARQRLGFSERTVPCEPGDTPRRLLERVAPEFPLEGVRVAVDCEYVSWDAPIGAAREVAVLPPVSGG
jgi:molybdopterin converting factor small subunit